MLSSYVSWKGVGDNPDDPRSVLERVVAAASEHVDPPAVRENDSRVGGYEDGVADAPLEAPQCLLAGLALPDLLAVVGPPRASDLAWHTATMCRA
jgi:hypothetical protein